MCIPNHISESLETVFRGKNNYTSLIRNTTVTVLTLIKARSNMLNHPPPIPSKYITGYIKEESEGKENVKKL
jgi:hypothetical protein